MDNQEEKPKKTLGPIAIVFSALAAAFGVQSRKNQERDFSRGNIFSFIAAGVIFTALFVFTVATLVKLVLQSQ